MNRFYSNVIPALVMVSACLMSVAHGGQYYDVTAADFIKAAQSNEARERKEAQFKKAVSTTDEASALFKQAEQAIAEWDAQRALYHGDFVKMIKDNEDLAYSVDDENDGYSVAAKYLGQLAASVKNGSLPYNKETFETYKVLFLKIVPYIHAGLIKSFVDNVMYVDVTMQHDIPAVQWFCRDLLKNALHSVEDETCCQMALAYWFELHILCRDFGKKVLDECSCNNQARSGWIDLHGHDFASLDQAVLEAQNLIDATGQSFVHREGVCQAIHALIYFMVTYEQPGALEYGKKKFNEILAYVRTPECRSDLKSALTKYDIEKSIKDGIAFEAEGLRQLENMIAHADNEREKENNKKEYAILRRTVEYETDLMNAGHEKITDWLGTQVVMLAVTEIMFPIAELLYQQGKINEAHACIKEVYEMLKQQPYLHAVQGLVDVIDALKKQDGCSLEYEELLNHMYGVSISDWVYNKTYHFFNGLELP